MGVMDKPYVVIVKKVFHLKHGDIKESVSRCGFYSQRGTERFVKRMRSWLITEGRLPVTI